MTYCTLLSTTCGAEGSTDSVRKLATIFTEDFRVTARSGRSCSCGAAAGQLLTAGGFRKLLMQYLLFFWASVLSKVKKHLLLRGNASRSPTVGHPELPAARRPRLRKRCADSGISRAGVARY